VGLASVDEQHELAADVALLADPMCVRGLGEREGPHRQGEPALGEQPGGLVEGVVGPLPAAAAPAA
jgi:hypothetical protein